MADMVVATRSRRTPEAHVRRQASDRRSRALDGLVEAIEESSELEVPPPVLVVERIHYAAVPKLPAEAFELARQVYYLQHGTIADAARAVIAAGLSDTDNETTVSERLKTWWHRERWPKRRQRATLAIRDANNDGGVYRSRRICVDVATGNGPAPKGKACTQSALPDSDYCFHHDPRPEYVEWRARQTATMRAKRDRHLVPLAPFQQWVVETGARLLEEARGGGRAHPNERNGIQRVSRLIELNNAQLHRLVQGKHTGKNRPPVTKIKAKTVATYLERGGTTFEAVYGFPMPEAARDPELSCPECGRRKNHASKLCRDCYDRSAYGEQCKYVPATGRPCQTRTNDPSGYCRKCRETVFFVPKQRSEYNYAPGAIEADPIILLYALDEYRRVESHRLVAERLWSVNARDIRAKYRACKNVTAQLSKVFRKRGWTHGGGGKGAPAAPDREAIAAAYEQLVAEHGVPAWPAPVAHEPVGLVPATEFIGWLSARYAELGSGRGTYRELGRQVSLHPEYLSALMRGRLGRQVKAATVIDALAAWGDGTTFAHLYGGAS